MTSINSVGISPSAKAVSPRDDSEPMGRQKVGFTAEGTQESKDSFEKKEGMSTGKKVAIGAGILTGMLVIGSAIKTKSLNVFSKDFLKNLNPLKWFKKAEKVAQKEAEKVVQKASSLTNQEFQRANQLHTDLLFSNGITDFSAYAKESPLFLSQAMIGSVGKAGGNTADMTPVACLRKLNLPSKQLKEVFEANDNLLMNYLRSSAEKTKDKNAINEFTELFVKAYPEFTDKSIFAKAS